MTISPDRPTWLEIDLGAIAHNVRRLKALAGEAQLMISLKADAYGHGAIQVAQTALLNGATWLGVACFGEGVALRQAGIRASILILGYTPAWQVRANVLRHDITATVFDLDVARAFCGSTGTRPPRVSTSRWTPAWTARRLPGSGVGFHSHVARATGSGGRGHLHPSLSSRRDE